MTYVLPENVTGFLSFINYINLVTGENLFFPLIIGAIWFIIFMASKAYTTPRAITIASFFAMVLCIVGRIVGLVSNTFMFLFIILTAFGIIWLHFENAKE